MPLSMQPMRGPYNVEPIYAIQYHTFSAKFLGLLSGQTSASSAALPVQMSASLGLMKDVRLMIFQPANKRRYMGTTT